jgi:hypothetical protein
MPRTAPRPRRRISSRRVWTLKLLGFRYSTSRDAYVLRVIGNSHGPVYQVQRTTGTHNGHDVSHPGVS